MKTPVRVGLRYLSRLRPWGEPKPKTQNPRPRTQDQDPRPKTGQTDKHASMVSKGRVALRPVGAASKKHCLTVCMFNVLLKTRKTQAMRRTCCINMFDSNPISNCSTRSCANIAWKLLCSNSVYTVLMADVIIDAWVDVYRFNCIYIEYNKFT